MHGYNACRTNTKIECAVQKQFPRDWKGKGDTFSVLLHASSINSDLILAPKAGGYLVCHACTQDIRIHAYPARVRACFSGFVTVTSFVPEKKINV